MNFKQNAEKLLITCTSRRNVRSQSHTKVQSLHDLGRAAAVLRWLTSDQSDHQPPGLAAGVDHGLHGWTPANVPASLPLKPR